VAQEIEIRTRKPQKTYQLLLCLFFFIKKSIQLLFGWLWLVAGADLLLKKSAAGWLVAYTDLV